MSTNFEHISNYDDIPFEDIIISEDDTSELEFLDDIFNVKF